MGQAMIEFKVEKLNDVRNELELLTKHHWMEIVDNPDEMELDIDWEAYEQAEKVGILLIITARAYGKLIGYVVHFIHKLPHYKWCIAAKDDAYYLSPIYRSSNVGLKLFNFVEEHLKSLNVKRIIYHCKLDENLDKSKFFERMGYEAVEKLYMKNI